MPSGGKPHYATRLAVGTYDLFHAGTADLPFYLDCARRFGGPILELGAGTGRVLIALAEAGYEIVGVEVSAAMLEAASAKIAKWPAAAARIRLVDADMKDFALQQTFSLVIIPARLPVPAYDRGPAPRPQLHAPPSCARRASGRRSLRPKFRRPAHSRIQEPFYPRGARSEFRASFSKDCSG